MPQISRTACRLVPILASALIAAVIGSPAAAQQTMRIAAVVNDEVISVFDLSQRLKMALYSSGLPDTPEQRERLVPRVLQTLIDETLQVQEARRRNISITDADMSQAVKMLERRNGVLPGGFEDFLKGNGLDPIAVKGQVRASLTWNKLLTRRVAPTIDVGEEEVDAVIARLAARQGQTENLLSEIFLAVDNPEDEAEIRQLAERLITQMQSGADFAAVAGQFSQSASAAVGGDIGWMQRGLLGTDSERAIENMAPGALSPPIRTPDGYQILRLRDRRRIEPAGADQTEVSLRQFVLPLRENSPPGEVESQVNLAKQIAASAADCADFARLAAKTGTPQAEQPARIKLGDLSETVRAAVAALEASHVSEPLVTPAGVQIIMVCARSESAMGPDRDQIIDQIGRERLQMLARRYLRDLKRAATIDRRL